MAEKISKDIAVLPYGPPAVRQSKRKNLQLDITKQVEEVADQMIKKVEDFYQHSAAFDYYRQTSTTGPNSNVLEQLYGRNLTFLRQYYLLNSPVDKIIFGKRNDQMRNLSDCIADNPNKVGWRVVHKDSDSPNFKTNKGIDKQCRFYEELIKSPNKTRHTGGHQDAFIAMLESKMLFDRIPIEKLKHLDRKWNGLPASWLVPDAATIKPTTWVLQAMGGSSGYTNKLPGNQARQAIHNSQTTAKQLLAYSADQALKRGTTERFEYERLTSGIIKWVQEMPDHQIAAGYMEDDLSVFIGNPSPQVNAWGWSSGSAFERSFAFGEVIFKMTGYNAEIFDSHMLEGVLSINDAGRDKRSKQQFHQRMVEEGTDRFNNVLVQFVQDPDKDVKYLKIKDKPTDMQFEKLFILYIKLKCSAYGFDYRMLNLEDGKSGGLGGSAAQEKQMDMQNEMGIVSDTKYIAHCLTKALINPWSPDYRMEFVHDVSESKDHIELITKKQAFTSMHETRKTENLEEDWWKEAPKEYHEKLKEYALFYYMPGMSPAQLIQIFVKKMDQDMQKEMAEEEAKQKEAEGVEGGQEEPEEPKEDQEITDLKTAIGQQEQQNKELAGEMEKGFSVNVNHHYVN